MCILWVAANILVRVTSVCWVQHVSHLGSKDAKGRRLKQEHDEMAGYIDLVTQQLQWRHHAP